MLPPLFKQFYSLLWSTPVPFSKFLLPLSQSVPERHRNRMFLGILFSWSLCKDNLVTCEIPPWWLENIQYLIALGKYIRQVLKKFLLQKYSQTILHSFQIKYAWEECLKKSFFKQPYCSKSTKTSTYCMSLCPMLK